MTASGDNNKPQNSVKPVYKLDVKVIASGDSNKPLNRVHACMHIADVSCIILL